MTEDQLEQKTHGWLGELGYTQSEHRDTLLLRLISRQSRLPQGEALV